MKFFMAFKQIHSCCATFSSNDIFLKQILEKNKIDFTFEKGDVISSKNYPFLNGETVKYAEGDKKFLCIYLEAEKKFYYNGRSSVNADYSKTDEFKNLIQKYIDAGWDKGKRYPEEIAYSERCKIIEQKQLKKDKVVLWMGFDQYKGHPELFQGGFSDSVFHSPELSRYVKDGMAYGWIGNGTVRTAAHDKQIERGLRKRGISDNRMYNWISSTSGRHFADSLEGYTKQEQKEKIENGLAYMYNDCVIFGSKFHEGTMKSTGSLSSAYDKFGILLDSKEKYNKQKHIKALMDAKEKVTLEINNAQDEEFKNFYTEISNTITEIFMNLI